MNPIIQTQNAFLGSLVTCSTIIPYDDTIPQSSEGDEVLTVSITPRFSNSKLLVVFSGVVSLTNGNSNDDVVIALFKNSESDAVYANAYSVNNATCVVFGYFQYNESPGTTNPITFKIRIGPCGSSSSIQVNGRSTPIQVFDGVCETNLTVTEYL